jgi:hypothetical protein
MFRFPRGELLVNITFLMRYSYEELVEFGECFVEWLRETNPFIKLPEKAVSTWFVRRVFEKDSLTPEEIAAHNDLCRALCQKGTASRWLAVIRPNLTKEDCDELLRGGFTCADFTPEEHKILCSKMGELGMKGSATSLHKLIDPDLSPAEYEELIATKGADVLLEELWMKRCVSK